MNSPDLTLFWIAFLSYLVGFILYSVYLAFKKENIAKIALVVMIIGFIPQTAGFFVRWVLSEHVPLSNMYEYIGLMSWMAVLCLFILMKLYKNHIFGGFIAPVAFMLMVTASLLPKDLSQALMPALQSYWLTIHVTLAALGSGAFAVGCAVSVVYLLKRASETDAGFFTNQASLVSTLLAMIVFPILFAFLGKAVGFLPESKEFAIIFGQTPIHEYNWLLTGIGLALPFGALIWALLYKKMTDTKKYPNYGIGIFAVAVADILVSSLIAGILVKWEVVMLTSRSAWKLFEFFGVTWVLSIPLFFLAYWILGIKTKSLFKKVKINVNLLEEINYKTISLGYPLYTIGALFAGAIWAEQAWGTFWGWDPKEVGALIIWLFYSGFLHAHKYKDWRGNRAAILAIFGLLMILLSFFGNYFFGGQHAYA